jgi:Phage terminase large subunit
MEGADIVWIDEARTINSKSMEILLPTVRAPGSELIWSWNPELPSDPVDAYFRDGKPPPQSIVSFVDYDDNPFFKHTTLPYEMEVLKQGNYDRYRHVWLGEYDLSYDSKVFSNIKVGRIDVPWEIPPLYGMDFGFGADPSFVVKCYLIEKTRQIFIAAEASASVPLDMLPAMLRSVLADDGDLVKADSSQPGTIEFLQARGFNIHGAKKGPGSVKSGINFLQGYEIVIDPNCEAMREEARLYSWMTDRLTGRALSVPVDANNHGWDALRYATESAQIETAMEGDETGGVLSLKLW